MSKWTPPKNAVRIDTGWTPPAGAIRIKTAPAPKSIWQKMREMPDAAIASAKEREKIAAAVNRGGMFLPVELLGSPQDPSSPLYGRITEREKKAGEEDYLVKDMQAKFKLAAAEPGNKKKREAAFKAKQKVDRLVPENQRLAAAVRKYGGKPSVGESFGAGFMELPLGVSALVSGDRSGAYANRAIAEQHPLAAMAGSLAPSLIPFMGGAAAGGKAASLLGLGATAGRIGGAGLAGLGIGALEPAETAQERALNALKTGGQFALAEPLFMVGGEALNAIRPSTFARRIAREMEIGGLGPSEIKIDIPTPSLKQMRGMSEAKRLETSAAAKEAEVQEMLGEMYVMDVPGVAKWQVNTRIKEMAARHGVKDYNALQRKVLRLGGQSTEERIRAGHIRAELQGESKPVTPKQFPRKDVPAAAEITDAELNAALGREPKPTVTRESGFIAQPQPGALAKAASRAGKTAVEVGRIFGSTTEQGLHPDLASNLRLSYARTRNTMLRGLARQRWIQDVKGRFKGTAIAERNNAFDLAESFTVRGGEPVFGARERALNPEFLQDEVMAVLKREYGQAAGPIGEQVASLGMNTTPEAVADIIVKNGADITPAMAEKLNYSRMRYTPEQSAAMWEKATPKERDAAMWWRINADEIRQRNPWIHSDIEAYVHHAHTTAARKAWINAVKSPLMKKVTAGWTKFRKGVEGYNRDLRRVALEYFPEVEAEAIRRNFMAELERAYTEPTFKVPAKNMVKYTAEFAPELKGKEFSLPEVFVKKLRMDKSEFIDYLVDPAAQSEMMSGLGYKASRTLRQTSTFWRVNALAYAPQTFVTNQIGGILQIGFKNLHDMADLVVTSVIKPSEVAQKTKQLFYDLWAIPAATKDSIKQLGGKQMLTREMLGENITREGLEGKGITEQVLGVGMAPVSWGEDWLRRIVFMSEAGWKTRKLAQGLLDGTLTAEELTMIDNARAMVDKFILNYKTNPKWVNWARDGLIHPFMSYTYQSARTMTGELPVGAKMVSRAQNPIRFRGKALNSGEALEVYQGLIRKRGNSRGLTNAERDAIAQYNTVIGKQVEGLPLTEADSAILARNEKIINEKGGWFGLNKEEWDFIREFKSRDVREKIAGTIALGSFLFGIAEWRERAEKADPSGVTGNRPDMPWELSTAGRVYVGRRGDVGIYFKANKYTPLLYASADGLRALGYRLLGRGNRASAILGDASEEFISEQLNAGPTFEIAAALWGYGNKYQAGAGKGARLGAVGASFIPGQRVTSQVARWYEAEQAPKSFTEKYGMPQYRRDTPFSALTQNIPVVSQETKGRLKLYPSGKPKGLKRDIWGKRAIWGVNVTEVSLSERMKWAKESGTKILSNDWLRNYIRVKYPFKADIPAMRKEYTDEELNKWIAGTGEALTAQERARMKLDMRQKLLKWQRELANQ